MNDFIKLFLGGSSERVVKRLFQTADRIDELEPKYKAMSDAELMEQTPLLKQKLKSGTKYEDILPDAFAVVREAAVRTLGQQAFREQLIGGIVLHQGRIAELKTGEGKTLMATFPAYLNALAGEGVHVVTVNDYLARFHSQWMGKVYRFLGMSVGLIVAQMPAEERVKNYAADITYGTNSEFGFDYLRDNMVIHKEQMVQRALHFAIVDEVDSILIDEARTPLIISGMGDKSTDLYKKADVFVRKLRDEEDYVKDEKLHTVNLNENGTHKAETYFGIENLSDLENTEINHHINQALRANVLMHREKDYIIHNGEIMIVDEFTGRMMVGRRYSEGLHQAIEAKEGVRVQRESKTLATITLQNYFRMYRKLSGMTGTAKTEEDEFRGIYNMDVVEIPTHRPMIRKDFHDVVYSTERGKFNAVVEEVVERHAQGQPILVGTVSVEKSEVLSEMLHRRGVEHEVLNAKYHAKEAEIIAQAGRLGAVTIATNMAGRGTDILLGGNPDFMARRELRRLEYTDELIEEAVGHAETLDEQILTARALYRSLLEKYRQETDAEHDKVVLRGGLHIIGTERHESRRIDNQLRGRSGRQGDPGSSRFYVALNDELMRLFGSDRIKGIVERLGMDESTPIESGLLTKQIEIAQKRVEARNFDIRKHVLQYDDVMNRQREIIYGQRQKVLRGEDIHASMMEMMESFIGKAADAYAPANNLAEEWDFAGYRDYMERNFHVKDCLMISQDELINMEQKQLKERTLAVGQELYAMQEAKIREAGVDMREVERVVLLQVVDTHWMDHIDAMDQLRKGIGLRAYGQRDPVIEFKIEGFEMFEEMVNAIQEEAIRLMFQVNVEKVPERKQVAQPMEQSAQENPMHRGKTTEKVGRNDPCPCGSGKKYKTCCGKSAGN